MIQKLADFPVDGIFAIINGVGTVSLFKKTDQDAKKNKIPCIRIMLLGGPGDPPSISTSPALPTFIDKDRKVHSVL
jgi:hypothetical protein